MTAVHCLPPAACRLPPAACRLPPAGVLDDLLAARLLVAAVKTRPDRVDDDETTPFSSG